MHHHPRHKMKYCHKCQRYHEVRNAGHNRHGHHGGENMDRLRQRLKEKERRFEYLQKYGYRVQAMDYIYRAMRASGKGWTRSMFDLLDSSNLRYLFDHCRHRVYHVKDWSTKRVTKFKRDLENNLRKEDKELEKLKSFLELHRKFDRNKEKTERRKNRSVLINFIRYELGGEKRIYSSLTTRYLVKKARRAVEKRIARVASPVRK